MLYFSPATRIPLFCHQCSTFLLPPEFLSSATSALLFSCHQNSSLLPPVLYLSPATRIPLFCHQCSTYLLPPECSTFLLPPEFLSSATSALLFSATRIPLFCHQCSTLLLSPELYSSLLPPVLYFSPATRIPLFWSPELYPVGTLPQQCVMETRWWTDFPQSREAGSDCLLFNAKARSIISSHYKFYTSPSGLEESAGPWHWRRRYHTWPKHSMLLFPVCGLVTVSSWPISTEQSSPEPVDKCPLNP